RRQAGRGPDRGQGGRLHRGGPPAPDARPRARATRPATGADGRAAGGDRADACVLTQWIAPARATIGLPCNRRRHAAPSRLPAEEHDQLAPSLHRRRAARALRPVPVHRGGRAREERCPPVRDRLLGGARGVPGERGARRALRPVGRQPDPLAQRHQGHGQHHALAGGLGGHRHAARPPQGGECPRTGRPRPHRARPDEAVEVRIVFLVSSMHSGGAERVAATLCNAWAARGDDVTLVATYSGRGECHYALADGVRLVYLADLLPKRRGPVLGYLSRLFALRRLLRGQRPDVVVSFLSNVNVTAILATRGLGLSLVVCERTDPLASS